MILTLNAIICLLIALRLFFYRRNQHCTYRPLYNWLAWVLMCSTASVAVLSVFGWYRFVFIAEITINTALLVCVVAARGNVANLIKPFRQKELSNDPKTHP